eukprot:jgi/Mesvir1/22554/Mv18566-RA.1
MASGGGLSGAESKTALRLTCGRIKLQRNKKEVANKALRKDIADLLAAHKEDSARIRVEAVLREYDLLAAYDILELFCELLTVRLQILEASKECPLDLKEAVSTLIYAAPRTNDLPDLMEVRRQFSAKFGKEFVAAAEELRPGCGVNRKIIEKLAIKAPDVATKLAELRSIATEFNVEWNDERVASELLAAPADLLDGLGGGAGFQRTPATQQPTGYGAPGGPVFATPAVGAPGLPNGAEYGAPATGPAPFLAPDFASMAAQAAASAERARRAAEEAEATAARLAQGHVGGGADTGPTLSPYAHANQAGGYGRPPEASGSGMGRDPLDDDGPIKPPKLASFEDGAEKGGKKGKGDEGGGSQMEAPPPPQFTHPPMHGAQGPVYGVAAAGAPR